MKRANFLSMTKWLSNLNAEYSTIFISIGGGALILSEVMMILQVEPFYSWFYCFVWWSYIIFIDGIIHKKKGNSLIISRGKEFLLLVGWSIVVWLFFEFVNIFLKNWYYINATSNPFFQSIGFVLSYGTVFPALFETFELLNTTSLFSSTSQKPIIRVTENLNVTLFLAGLISLFLPFLLPNYGFPLVWIGLIFLLEPINYKFSKKSILRDLENGQPRRLYLLLLTGMICGFLWEFWNFWAKTKWVYTVPFFEDFKIFEMPLLGFFGFPPFTLECYVIMNFIGIFRSGRGWEEDLYNIPIKRRLRKPFKVIIIFIAVGWCLFNFKLIDRYTIKSYYPLIDEVGNDKMGEIAILKREGISTFEELRAISKGFDKKAMALKKAGLSNESLDEWIDCANLVLLKGMGTKNYLLLREAGIRSLSELANQDPHCLWMKLKGLYSRSILNDKFPDEAMIRIWIKEAKNIRKRS